MKYNFDNLANRKNTNSYKWDYKKDALTMWIADMDFKSPPFVVEAIKRRVAIEAYGYSFIDEKYYQAYINWWNRRHHVTFEREWMIYSSGVVASISSMVRSLTNVGDNILVISPVYNIFFNSILNNKRHAIECEFDYKEGRYSLDFEKLENLIKDKEIRLLIFCNPHNPVGYIWSKEEIQKLQELAEEYSFYVISDEIHADFTKPGVSYNSYLSVQGGEDRCIIALAPSKTFNIAGLQSACLVIPNEELRNRVNRGLNNDEVAEPNFFSIQADIAAYENGDEWVDQLKEYIQNNKEYLYSFIENNLPNLKVVKADSLYLVWVDISHYSNDSVAFTNDLYEKTGLFVSEGSEYHGNGHNFIRINVATSLANIKEGCTRLMKYIQSLKI